jgi:uncharacterized protein
VKPHFLSPLLKAGANRYVLRNERTGAALASRVVAAVDSASRRKGLLGRTDLPVDEALIIAPCSSIHTFFMKFTIDVAFVSKDGTVLRLCHSLAPWRIGLGLWAFAAVELPAGTLVRTDTQRRDRLAFVPIP